jgi:acyl-CoA thioesterase-1
MDGRLRDTASRSKRRREHYFLALAAAWCALLGPSCGEQAPASGRPTAAAARPDASVAAERAAPAQTGASARAEVPVVLFVGTSLTAGYGLPAEEAFPALVQERIDAAGLPYRVVNAGVSGDTSAGGLRRIDWLLRMPVAVLVLELGANDMLRGQSVGAMRANLRAILDRTREVHPDARIVIAGMRAAPNLGTAYASEFDGTFATLADQYDATLIPFLLDGVAAVRRLNQPDGIHPTAEGHEIVAETVWRALEPILRGS